MNKRFFSLVKIFLFAGFILFLAACSNNVDNTGSATFSISKQTINTAIENSLKANKSLRAISLNEDDVSDDGYNEVVDVETIEIKVSLQGDYEDTKVISYSMKEWNDEMEKLYGSYEEETNTSKRSQDIIKVSFDKIPYGDEVYAEAELAFVYEEEGQKKRSVAFKGTSDKIKIKSSENPLSLVLKRYTEPIDFVIQFYFEDENSTDTDYPGYVHKSQYDKTITITSDKEWEEVYNNLAITIEEYLASEDFRSYEYDKAETLYKDSKYTYVVFFKKASSPITLIDYEVYYYKQKADTTYEEDKGLEEQLDIFESSFKAEAGDTESSAWSTRLTQIIARHAVSTDNNYTYIGYRVVEKDGKYLINFYFANNTSENPPAEETAIVNVSCSIPAGYNDPSELTEDDLALECKISVTLTDEDKYSETKEVKIKMEDVVEANPDINDVEDLLKLAKLTFDDVPVGTITAKASVYVIIPLDEDSDGQSVSEGQSISEGQSVSEEQESETPEAITYLIAKTEYKAKVIEGTNNWDLVLDLVETPDKNFDYIIEFYFEDKDSADTQYPGYTHNTKLDITGSSDGWDDFDTQLEDNISDTVKQFIELGISDYEETGYEGNFNNDGVYVYRIFYKKIVVTPPVETINYAISYYIQKKGTVYDKDLKPSAQKSIFEFDSLAVKGETEKAESYDDSDILDYYKDAKMEDYINCGYSIEEPYDGYLDIIIYFRLANEEVPPVEEEKEIEITVSYAYEKADSSTYEVDTNKINKFTVTCKTNEDPTDLIQQQLENQLPTLIAAGTKDGYVYSKKMLEGYTCTLYYVLIPENSVNYTIKYLGQNIQGNDYTALCDAVTGSVASGSTITPEAKSFDGFELEAAIAKVSVTEDNNVFEIKYKRKQITYTFDPKGGNWNGSTTAKTVSGKYGAAVEITDPAYSGRTFTGWNKTVPSTFGTENLSFEAQWAANSQGFTINMEKLGEDTVTDTLKITVEQIAGEGIFILNIMAPESSVPLTYSLYVDGKLVLPISDKTPGQFETSVKAGVHAIMLEAKDTDGNQYAGTSTWTVREED